MGLQRLMEVKDASVEPRPRWFGKYRRTQAEWRDLQTIKEYTEIDLREEYIKYADGFFNDRAALEKKGMHRSMAVDWLFGTYVRPLISVMHDQATSLIENTAAHTFEQILTHKWSRQMLVYMSQVVWISCEHMVMYSKMYKRLLQY